MPTELTINVYGLIHFLFGYLGVMLGFPYLFTGIFVVKQLIDYHAGEESEITSGDLVEFSGGLVFALLTLKVLMII